MDYMFNSQQQAEDALVNWQRNKEYNAGWVANRNNEPFIDTATQDWKDGWNDRNMEIANPS